MKQALLCDLDMTLINSRRDIVESLIEAAKEGTGRELTEEEISPFIGKGLHILIGGLFPDRDNAGIEELIELYRKHFQKRCDVHTTAYPGVLDTLQLLRGKGYRVGIVTNKMTAMAQFVCDRLGIARLFDVIQGTDGTRGKPDPHWLLEAMNTLGMTPEQCVFIGDTIGDVQAAKAAGVFSVAATWGIGKREDLVAENPDAMIDAFPDIVECLER